MLRKTTPLASFLALFFSLFVSLASAQVLPSDRPLGRVLLRPKPLECNQVESGFAAPTKTLRYVFRGTSGNTVDLAVNEVSGFVDSFCQATLFAPSGDKLGVFIGSQLETITLPETGKYRISLTSTGYGSFTIAVGCPTQGATSLICGDLSPASLSSAGELDYYSFDALADDFIQLILTKAGGFASGVPRGTLFAPSGAELLTLDADKVVPLTLPETGTYTVRVSANDLFATGSYNVGLSCLPPAGAIPLTCDSLPMTSSPSGVGTLTYFTFDGGLDEVVEMVIVGGGNSIPQVRVFTPLGVQIGLFTADSIQPLRLPETGLFTVEVRPATLAQLGPFTISVACRDPLGPSTNLACASGSSGFLDVGEVDYYTFTGTANDVAEITLTTTAGFPGISNPQMRVFTPTGFDLGAFTADSVNPITLPDTGDYTIRVNSNTLVDTGSYSIALACLPPSGSSHVGDDSLTPGTIAVAAEVDTFTFDGEAGEIVELPLVATSGFAGTSARATLFAPSGVNLGAFSGGTLAVFTLPETGGVSTGDPYELEVEALDGLGTGTYNVGLERRQAPGGTANPDPQAPPLVCGQLIATSIAQPGELDYFRFQASSGDQIQLTLVRQGFTSGYARATLFSPSGVSLGTLDSNNIQGFTLPDTGEYAVRVFTSDLTGTGDYSLGLECIAPLGPVEGHLVCGDLVTDSISARAEVDYFSFDASVGDQVQLTLVGQGLSSGYVRATVFAPSGAAQATLDANGIRAYSLPETGTYAIRVWTSDFFGTGTYHLGLECVAPLGPVEDHLVNGDLVTDTISAIGEVDYFSFDASVGDQVQLTLVRQGLSSGYVRATVFAPSGAALATLDSNNIQAYALPETGTYGIRVWTSDFFGTGTYYLGLEGVAPLGPVVDHLECGDLITSSISAIAEVDYFSFDASVGDQVQLTLIRQGFSSGYVRATVFAPSGAAQATLDSNNIVAYVLPETGTYGIRVWTSDLLGTGTYHLGLECVAPLGPVEDHLVNGDLVTDTISAIGEVDYFSFDASAGDQVQLTLVRQGFSSGYVRATVFAPSGAAQATLDSNNIVAYVLPETGTYGIRVWTSDFLGTGTYHLGLEGVAPLGPVVDHLECGDLITSSISAIAEVDYFSFDASVGDQVQLTLVRQGFSSGYVRATVFAPSGAAQATLDSNNILGYVLPETGTYGIRVWTSDFVGTGTYHLGLECVVPSGPVQGHLGCGDVVSSSISAIAEVDYYSFDATSGDSIDVTLTGSGYTSGYARATVYAPSGASLGTCDANGLCNYSLSETGTYVVRVWTSDFIGTGNYNLGLGCLP